MNLIFFGRVVFPSRTAFVAAAVLFVDGRPRAFFGFVLGETLFFVAFFDVFRLTFLFVSVFVFFSSRHNFPLDDFYFYKMLRDRFRKDLFNLTKRSCVSIARTLVTIVSSIFMEFTSETSCSRGFNGKTTDSVLKTSISPFILLSSLENKALVILAK
jgi:hypothetical protein